MFYKPGTPHNLPRDPFKACVIPRPIGWISSVSASGIHNLAPFSQFNNLNFDPPYVMFSANNTHHGRPKDSAANAAESGFFVWNLATWALRDAVNKSATYLPPEVDEFDIAGVEKEYSTVFPTCPRVKESPVHFDCRYHMTIRLPGKPPLGGVNVVIAEVVGIHIKDEVLTDGILDVKKTQPIARCGYHQYARITETFEMVIPSSGDVDADMAMNSGLEGSVKDMVELAGRVRGLGTGIDKGKGKKSGEEKEKQEEEEAVVGMGVIVDDGEPNDGQPNVPRVVNGHIGGFGRSWDT